MWSILNIWLGKGLEKLALGLGAAAAVAAIWFRGRSKGAEEERQRQEARRQEQQNAQLSARLKAGQEAQEKRDEIASLPDSAADRRLRDNWTRNGDR